MPDDFVWELMIADLGSVRFVGEKPGGYPTEMWLNGEIVERDMGGSFAWSTEAGAPVPTPVHVMNETVRNYQGNGVVLCDFIEEEIQRWSKLRDDPTASEAAKMRAAVCAQYAKVVYSIEGCD